MDVRVHHRSANLKFDKDQFLHHTSHDRLSYSKGIPEIKKKKKLRTSLFFEGIVL